MVNGVAQHGVGRHSTTQITKQTGETSCSTGRLLRCQLQRIETDQHDRAVDEEADGHQCQHVDGRVASRVKPVNQHEQGYQHHEQDTGRRTAALEHLVRDPAAQQGARNTGPLIEEVSPGGFVDAEILGLFQVGRRPVQYTVTNEVNEGVGNGDVPQQFVVQHVLDEDLLGGKLLLVALVVILGKIVLVLFDGWQADRLRGITHHEEGDHRDGSRCSCRDIEGTAPVVEPAHPQNKQRANHAAAHVVGHVPDRDHFTPLFL